MHYAEILGDPRIAPYKWIANYSASIGLARSTSNAIPSGKCIKPIRIIENHFLSIYVYFKWRSRECPTIESSVKASVR